MLYREIIAICSELRTEHINTVCGQKVEFFNVKPGGTYRNHWTLKGHFSGIRTSQLTLWRRNYFFLILAHSVYKM